MTRYPYPIRDWRNPSEYPKPADLDPTGWAWEFLRRNPEYQRLWDVFDALPDHLEAPHGQMDAGIIAECRRVVEQSGIATLIDVDVEGGEELEDGHSLFSHSKHDSGQKGNVPSSAQVRPFSAQVRFKFELPEHWLFSYSKYGSSGVPNLDFRRRGTPDIDFRFLTDGPGWYADPEPIPGEHVSEYEARHPEGCVMPFADYLMKRFRLMPWPIAPTDELTKRHGFNDVQDGYSESPQRLDLSRPPASLVERYPETYEGERDKRLDELAADPMKVPILFDMRKPIEEQLGKAREILKYAAGDLWRTGWTGEPISKESRPQFRPREHARHIRLLDAAAVGATLEEMAAALHPREANGLADGYRVTKRLRKELQRAEQLRDVDYSRFPTRGYLSIFKS